MARNLYLFKETTPNIDGGFHLISENPFNIVRYLEDVEKLVDTIPLDNYRINTNTIKVKYKETYEEVINNISYIIDADFTNAQLKYFRAYFVDSYEIQSGYVVFNCRIDLWGSYAHKAVINNTLEIKATKMEGDDVFNVYEAMGGITSAQQSVNYIKDEDVAIVFYVACVISDNILHSEPTTQILPFACKLSYLRGLFDSAIQTRYHSAEIASMVVSGITALPTSAWYFNTDAEVQKIYIVPNAILNYDDWGFNFISKSKASESMEDGKVTFEARAIKPSKTALPFEIKVNDMDINKKYFVGVIGEGLELVHLTKDNYVLFDFEVSHDGIHVVVKQADNMKDISSHFQVSIIGNAIVEDTLQKIAWWGKHMSGVLSNAQSIAGASNYVAMGLKAGQFIGDTLGLFGERSKASGTISNGDGTITFDWYRGSDVTKVNYPFYFNKYQSAIDEEDHARRYGVNFKINLNENNLYDLTREIDTHELLGVGPFSATYIACESIVQGVPLQACEYIRNQLQKGVYVNLI